MRFRLLAAATLAVAAVSTAAPAAHAACVGTTQTILVCVYPSGLPQVDPEGQTYEDCVHVGLDDCVPVAVPIPTVERGEGPIVAVIPNCSGPIGCPT